MTTEKTFPTPGSTVEVGGQTLYATPTGERTGPDLCEGCAARSEVCSAIIEVRYCVLEKTLPGMAGSGNIIWVPVERFVEWRLTCGRQPCVTSP